MKFTSTLLIVLISSNSIASEFTKHIGTWQSNEQMTLDHIETIDGLPEKSKKFYQEEQIFGGLVVDFKEDSYASYFIGEKPDTLTYYKYTLTVLSENKIKIKFTESREDILLLSDEKVLTFEDDCFYVVISNEWQMKEYICRVQ